MSAYRDDFRKGALIAQVMNTSGGFERIGLLSDDGLKVWTGSFVARFGNLLAARLMLGFAVGAESGTTPVYSAESAPKTIRGALTIMWQMWTAFGICLGFVVLVAFQHTDFLGQNSQWGWMLGSTSIPPLIVMFQERNFYIAKTSSGDGLGKCEKW